MGRAISRNRGMNEQPDPDLKLTIVICIVVLLYFAAHLLEVF